MFNERQGLEGKLDKLKAVVLKVTELCDTTSVKVSFATFEAFKCLS